MKKTYLMIAAMAITGISNANIVYTDITDATLASGGSITINMDGAGGSEFSIDDNSFGGNPEPGIFFNANAGFVMLGTFATGGWDEIVGITLSTPINASSNFANNGVDGYIDPAWNPGTFPTTDTYIGATFKLGANTHYGWIRVNWTSASGTLIVKDFAYEDTPNTSIDAGDDGASTVVLVTSISIQGQSGASTITTPSGTLQISEAVLPANATNNAITWSVANGTGSATISATGLVTATGNGTVTVTASAADASGISGTTTLTISNQSTGIQESIANTTSIYPNPASDFLQITSNGISKVASLTIYSYNGQVVLQTKTESGDEKINISHLSSGAYMLVLTTNDGTINTKKWMKK